VAEGGGTAITAIIIITMGTAQSLELPV